MFEARVCGGSSTPKGRFQPDDNGTVTGHLVQVTTSRPGLKARTVGPDQNHWFSPHTVRKESAIRQ
jgi:hypothetical protein